MFCGKCGRKNREESKFCTECGNPINKSRLQEEKMDPTKPSKKAANKDKGSNKVVIVVGVILGIIAACIIGYYSVMSGMEKPKQESKPQIQGSNSQNTNKPVDPVDTKVGEVDLAAKTNPSGYIAKDSNVKVLDKGELGKLTRDDLGLIRNEIYARYGFIFKSPTYEEYFNSKTWYTPNSNFKGNDSDLNEIERQNISILKTIEGIE
ncbi:MAG: YARHG domain-containing protein [Clostridium sp.]